MLRSSLAIVAIAAVLMLACENVVGPVPLDRLRLSVVSGDGQSAIAGEELPEPLVVRVVDDKGQKVKGQIINFQVVSGDGQVFAGVSITDQDGLAQERWRLGPSGSQQVEARAVDTQTGEARTFAVFTATVLDNVPPTVTINQAAGQPDPTGVSPILFKVEFSEAVTGFEAADVSLGGSTAGGTLSAAVTGSGASYTVAVSGMTDVGTVVASIPAGAAQDAASNASTASTSNDNSVTFTLPTVTINQASTQPDPTGASPIRFTVTFSEPVTGFEASDVSVAGSSVAGTLAIAVTGSGAAYTVAVSGMTSSGQVTASMPAGAATSAAGQPTAASTSIDNTVTFNLALTVSINQAPGQADPTNASLIQFTVLFSEPVTGFDQSDVSFAGSTAGGALAASVSGSEASYTVSVTGMTGIGSVVVSIPAAAAHNGAGNPNFPSSSADNTVTFDDAAPDVTINQAAGQADPTGTIPILFNVQFTEPVTGFEGTDVSFVGSTAGGTVAAVSGSGASYTVSVTVITGGTVAASIPAGGVQDAAGNANAASTSTDNIVTFTDVAPEVTINKAAGQADPTGLSPIRFTVVFTQPVTGFTEADISFAGSTVGSTLIAAVNGSGAAYTVAVSGMTGIGNVVASIPAGAAQSAAGIASNASTSTDNSVAFDGVAPTVTINQAAGQSDPTSASPILFTAVFSEPVTGFLAADISFAGSSVGGTRSASVTGSGATYTVSVTGMTTSGTVTVSINAGAAVDAAGNSSAASSSLDNTVSYQQLFTVGGTVTGLEGLGCQLRLNNGPPLAITNNGSFTFPTGLATGAQYAVTVATQPDGPEQTCAVTNGAGVMGTSNVTTVSLGCTVVRLPCADAPFLGYVTGDDFADQFFMTGTTDQWFRVRIQENNSSVVYLSALVTLISPAGVDYDLEVYCSSCGGTLAGGSAQGAGQTDQVRVRAQDDLFQDDTGDILIHVIYYGGRSPSPYTLVVRGNTVVDFVTCNF